MITVLFVVGTAMAQAVDCTTGQAPANYDTEPCSNICQVTFGAFPQVTCAPASSTTDPSVTVKAVEDYQNTGDRTYSIWGIDPNGHEFCCFVDDEPAHDIVIIELWGSDDDDILAATSGASFNKNIVNADTRIFGFDGADTIDGSNAGACDDYIEGAQEADTISGHAGSDTLKGMNGPDVINGGDGADELWGGNQDDTLSGDDGTDELFGGEDDDGLAGGVGNDVLHGGDDNDVLEGGPGGDVLCGDATSGTGHDELHANTSLTAFEINDLLDKLWEPASSSTPTGSATSSDDCGHATHGTSWAGGTCDYSLTIPPEC